MLYKDVSSAVMNNGFETGHFPLFIIAAEILAIKIRVDNNIQGFKIGQEMLNCPYLRMIWRAFLKTFSRTMPCLRLLSHLVNV